MDSIGFQSILILLSVAFVLVALFHYLRLPQLLAYLAAGVLVGPHGLGWVAAAEDWRYLAEFGLVFLMFTIGLEFSLARLLSMKRIVFGLGAAQVLISCAAFAGVAVALGVPWPGAVAIGGILAMSSTAIVVRLLMDQLEQHSRHGRYAIGVLLFQDLIVVPFLILIPALGDANAPLAANLGWALAKGVVVLLAILALGRWVLPPLLRRVAATRLREYFMLAVLLLTLAAAAVTGAAGLSLALGAFLAGMMLAETEYRHQVEADILPFRDVLLGLFFVTIGMMLDLAWVQRDWQFIVAGVAAVLLFKTALIAVLGRWFGLQAGSALRTGLVLSQVGEFGFALLLLAQRHQVLEAAPAQRVLAIVVLTMLLAPAIIWYNGRVARKLVPSYQRARTTDLDAIRRDAQPQSGHVILCGYGRSGQNLAWMLAQESIESFALDLDPVRVREARHAGKRVVYGDATRRDVLEAAGIARASALVVSFNDVPIALKILELTRALRPDMPVIVRTMDDADLERLTQAGATEVVPESLEGSLMMGSHVLLLLGVPAERIVRHVTEVRRGRYRMLRGFFHGQAMLSAGAYRARLQTVALADGAFAVDKALADVALERTGAMLTALRRDGREHTEQMPDIVFRAGDVLVLYGEPEALARAENLLLHGRE